MPGRPIVSHADNSDRSALPKDPQHEGRHRAGETAQGTKNQQTGNNGKSDPRKK